MATIIPTTNIRLVPYIDIYYQIMDTLDYTSTGYEGALARINPSDKLGFASKVDINSGREVHVLRSLGTDLAGRPAEIYPGLPDYSITISRVVLYSDDILEKLMGIQNGENYDGVVAQNKPLAFKFVLSKPDASGKTFETNRIVFAYDCWLTKQPFELDMEGRDLKIVQEIDIKARLIRINKS